MEDRAGRRPSDRRGDGLRRREFLRLTAGVAAPLLGVPAGRALAWAQMPAGAKRGGTLTVGINTDLVSLDPNDIVFANVPMFFQLYNYLVTFSTSLEPQPDLAESWELAKDGTSAVFRLRERVRTHSGGVFDADALLANFQRIKNKETGGGLFSRLEDFSAAEKVDARTVRFRFARPRPDCLAMVSRWGMIDPAAFATVKQKGGGTGPFKLGEWVPGDHVTFVRFDEYWQPGIPLLDRVVFRVLSDAAAMENAFRAGQIDIAHTIPNKDVQRLRAEGLQVVPAPVPNEYYVLIVNARRPPFDTVKVRQALRYALDRETISKTVLGGVGKPTVQVAAPGTPAYDPKLDGEFAFNSGKAKEFLAQGGLGGGQGAKLNFLVSTSTPESPEIAQIVQGDLKKLGFDVTLTIVEPSRYFPLYFKGDFDLTLSFLTLATLDPTDFTISSAYRLNATNPAWLETGPPREYVEAIQKLNSTVDRRDRWAHLRAAVRYLLEQAWALPIALRLPTYGVGKAVHGFAVDPQMILTARTTWVER
jgi:peptide/nickel transport system substrate-binding protein